MIRWTYGASKGAIDTMTKLQALDMAKAGIRVNSVSPGWIWTPEVAKAAAQGLITFLQIYVFLQEL